MAPANQAEQKRQVGAAALAYVQRGSVIGVGTGSTVDCFIDALARTDTGVRAAVSSSEASSRRLRAIGIAVLEAGEVESLPVYIDGADEIDPTGCMIKGGGAALTREKIVADLAERFVCIADASKWVERLGRFALPVEVIPVAAAQICRRFVARGARPTVRPDVRTDNGGVIVDVADLVFDDPAGLEAEINQWPGVVACGIFAQHRAAVCLLGTSAGVRTIAFPND